VGGVGVAVDEVGAGFVAERHCGLLVVERTFVMARQLHVLQPDWIEWVEKPRKVNCAGL